MRCIPKINSEYLQRMEDIITTYSRPYDPDEPVVCIDEKPVQLLEETKPSLPMKEKYGKRIDYKYTRKGSTNIFMGVEPKGGFRYVRIRSTKKKKDFAEFLCEFSHQYPHSRHIHVICDNYATHSLKCLQEVLGASHRLFTKLILHSTPKHACWLDLAELEIGILSRQCLKRHIPSESALRSLFSAWTLEGNAHYACLSWSFSLDRASNQFKFTPSLLP